MRMNIEEREPTRQNHPPDAEVNTLLALYNGRRFAEAESGVRALLEKYPGFGFGWKLMGNSLRRQGKDALHAFRKVIELMPEDAEAHFNLGNTVKDLGKLDDAIASYRMAVTLKPDFAMAYFNLGNVLRRAGKIKDAAESFRRTVEINPGLAQAHCNLGTALLALGQYNAAEASYRRAIEINPHIAEAYYNLGNALRKMGRLDDAEENYRLAVEIKPDYAQAQSNLLFTLNYTAKAPEYCLEEARRYGRMVSQKVTARYSTWQCAAHPERLRVGMVSGDLHNHPVGYFLESLLANLDPARVELIAYPTDLTVDSLTARIKPYFTAWKPLHGLSDEDAARLIHGDCLHVLLDLSGHTDESRLSVFAWKPAPVQVAWLGYFATTGVGEMDYLLADEVGVPEEQRKYFTETIWYLPDTRLCFTPPATELPVAALPAQKNGYITFGCFQNLSKVGDDVLAAWGSILNRLPSARLRWQCKQFGDPAVVAQLVERLQQHDIDPERVTMLGAVGREAYLNAHAEVDVMLDTFPFPGGTTTCEALWMGVPTITLAGETLLARQGASLLTAGGLEDWIVTSVEDYIAKAVAVANDLPKLAGLRACLREQVRVSALLNAQRFAKNVEDALWGMWQRYQDKQ
jgi:predicted O-linked N-acetylglucosamine transferase (SPINDLY family)